MVCHTLSLRKGAVTAMHSVVQQQYKQVEHDYADLLISLIYLSVAYSRGVYSDHEGSVASLLGSCNARHNLAIVTAQA